MWWKMQWVLRRVMQRKNSLNIEFSFSLYIDLTRIHDTFLNFWPGQNIYFCFFRRLLIYCKRKFRKLLYVIKPDIGLAVGVFANCLGDVGSIPGRVIPKTQKMVLDASLLNTQHYKVQIKGKVEQSRERSSALPYTLV